MTNKSNQIGRRQFLIASSTCAVAAATVGPKLLADAAAAPVRRLAIGFSPLRESADDAGVVFAATAVRSSDGAFISRGARVTVSGSSGAAKPADRRAVDLLAYFSILDGGKRSLIPVRAWAASRSTGTQGSGAAFNVPVDEYQKLVFSVTSERGMPAGGAATRRNAFLGTTETSSHFVTLALQNEAGALNLARGTYIIVPLFDGDRMPDWSGFELRGANARVSLHDRSGVVAPFDHFVLTVDYAQTC